MSNESAADQSVPSVASTVMTSSVSSLGMTGLMSRPAEVTNLRTLKAPEEGGSKKDYEEFIEKITNHVLITWSHGKDIADILKETKMPVLEEPEELSAEDAKSKVKVVVTDKDVRQEREI